MIAIATALSTLFGLFSADPKTPTAEPACCCGPSCASETAGARDQLNSASPPVYVCPMHPEVLSDKPGLCAKCNMKLELKPGAGPEWERAILEASRRWPE